MDMINLIPAGGFGGITGFMDGSNQMYMIQAKLSFRGTAQQNRMLEEALYRVYMQYLQEVASSNGGFY